MTTARDYLSTVNKKPEAAEGDYTKDGLLYCGKCNEPKQTRGDNISSITVGMLLSVPCRCAREAQEAAHKEAQQKRVRELRESCLPQKNMRESRFETAENTKAVAIAKKYVEHWEEMKANNAGLMFYGDVGTGKSFAAQCIANALIDREIPVRYISAADMLANFTAKNTNQDEYIKAISSVPLLIVDDLGAEYSTDYSQSQICRIIDARRESRRPLIVTTNYSPVEIQATTDRHKHRIFDRITAACVPVEVVGGSRRKKEGQKRLQAVKDLLLED